MVLVGSITSDVATGFGLAARIGLIGTHCN